MNAFNRDLVIGETVFYRGNAVRVLSGPGMSTTQIMSDALQIEYVDEEDGEIETIDAMAITDDPEEYFDTMGKSYHVLAVSRGDLGNAGFNFDLVSDAQMEWISEEMGDNEALMRAYWLALKFAAELFGIPKLQKERE
jgi:hypothetical protein